MDDLLGVGHALGEGAGVVADVERAARLHARGVRVGVGARGEAPQERTEDQYYDQGHDYCADDVVDQFWGRVAAVCLSLEGGDCEGGDCEGGHGLGEVLMG